MITKTLLVLLSFVGLTTVAAHAEENDRRVRLFERDTSSVMASTAEFRNGVFVGRYRCGSVDSLGTILNLGFDLPIAGYQWASSHYVDIGAAAACKMYLFPEGTIFHVDNLYAILAIYFAGRISPQISWRLYPIYHLSAHLVDGHDTLLKQKISNEMTFLQATFEPLPRLMITGGYGYYYHVIRDQALRQRIDLDVSYSYPILPVVDVFASAGNMLIGDSVLHYGIDLNVGALLTNHRGRGLGLSFSYFNKPHLGFFYSTVESGVGAEITFRP